ncbi:hypothetical protein EV189_3415 [Motilibacter rhizosphaerae]|uniref:Uncharacterized protein n=1 Tax=Motilibacter rhizosphaerae TaxID=598652 RepID=A0A4Q7NAM3_9ACTN|nr:hypothetical protein EV189_3415 [Motilibacter rhizosphaerae]
MQTISVHRSADASGTCLLLPGSATTAQGRVLAAAGSRSVALAPGATVVLRLSWTGTCAAEPVQVTVGARGGPFLAASVALPTCGTVTLASTVDPAR